MRTSWETQGTWTTAVVWGGLDVHRWHLWEVMGKEQLNIFQDAPTNNSSTAGTWAIEFNAHSIPGDGIEFTEAPTFRLAKAKAKAATVFSVGKGDLQRVGWCWVLHQPLFLRNFNIPVAKSSAFPDRQDGPLFRHVLDASDCPSSSDWAKEGFRNGTDSWGVVFFSHAGHSFHFSPTTWLVLCDLAASDWVVL